MDGRQTAIGKEGGKGERRSGGVKGKRGKGGG